MWDACFSPLQCNCKGIWGNASKTGIKTVPRKQLFKSFRTEALTKCMRNKVFAITLPKQWAYHSIQLIRMQDIFRQYWKCCKNDQNSSYCMTFILDVSLNTISQGWMSTSVKSRHTVTKSSLLLRKTNIHRNQKFLGGPFKAAKSSTQIQFYWYYCSKTWRCQLLWWHFTLLGSLLSCGI